jgi:ribosome-associated protein
MLPADETPKSAPVDYEKAALELGALLSEHRGIDVAVMDMRELNFWTDFFVIATVSSGAHLGGLERHIKEYAREKGLEILRRSRRPEAADDWCLVDFGNLVIHLMSAQARSFYELERLWSAAPLIYKNQESGGVFPPDR